MSNDESNPDDPTFDFEEFMDEADDEMTEKWPFELDDNGELMQQSIGRKQQAKLYGAVALGHAAQLLYTIVFFFLLVVGVTFLMNLFGVAFPVA